MKTQLNLIEMLLVTHDSDLHSGVCGVTNSVITNKYYVCAQYHAKSSTDMLIQLPVKEDYTTRVDIATDDGLFYPVRKTMYEPSDAKKHAKEADCTYWHDVRFNTGQNITLINPTGTAKNPTRYIFSRCIEINASVKCNDIEIKDRTWRTVNEVGEHSKQGGPMELLVHFGYERYEAMMVSLFLDEVADEVELYDLMTLKMSFDEIVRYTGIHDRETMFAVYTFLKRCWHSRNKLEAYRNGTLKLGVNKPGPTMFVKNSNTETLLVTLPVIGGSPHAKIKPSCWSYSKYVKALREYRKEQGE